MRVCSKCGKELHPSETFCYTCGGKPTEAEKLVSTAQTAIASSAMKSESLSQSKPSTPPAFTPPSGSFQPPSSSFTASSRSLKMLKLPKISVSSDYTKLGGWLLAIMTIATLLGLLRCVITIPYLFRGYGYNPGTLLYAPLLVASTILLPIAMWKKKRLFLVPLGILSGLWFWDIFGAIFSGHSPNGLLFIVEILVAFGFIVAVVYFRKSERCKTYFGEAWTFDLKTTILLLALPVVLAIGLGIGEKAYQDSFVRESTYNVELFQKLQEQSDCYNADEASSYKSIKELFEGSTKPYQQGKSFLYPDLPSVLQLQKKMRTFQHSFTTRWNNGGAQTWEQDKADREAKEKAEAEAMAKAEAEAAEAARKKTEAERAARVKLAKLTKFSTNQSGYSANVSIYIWPGMQGSGFAREFEYGGGNETIKRTLPEQANTALIFPFQIVIDCTTNYDFASEVEAQINAYNYPYAAQCNVYYTSGWSGESSSRSIQWRGEPVSKGDTKTIEGYIVISDVFSPAYPDGNSDKIPPMVNVGIRFSKANTYSYDTHDVNLPALENAPTAATAEPTAHKDTGKNTSSTIGTYLVVTKGDDLNLRSDAGESYSVAGRVPNLTSVTVTSTIQVDGEWWGYITYAGKTGYVAMRFLENMALD